MRINDLFDVNALNSDGIAFQNATTGRYLHY